MLRRVSLEGKEIAAMYCVEKKILRLKISCKPSNICRDRFYKMPSEFVSIHKSKFKPPSKITWNIQCYQLFSY